MKKIRSSQFYAFLTILLWSSAYVFTKVALVSFSPPVLGFLRCAVASLVLAAVLAARRASLPQLRDLPVFAVSGALGFSIYLLLFNRASETLTSTTGCILISTAPLITALMAAALFRERLSLAAWLATVVEFCGVLVLTLWNGVVSINPGVFWMLGAAVCISGYNLAQKKYAARYTSLQITAYSFFAATLMLVPFLPQACREIAAAPAAQIGTVVFLGACPGAIAYMWWAKALSLAENTSEVVNFMFLTPLLSLVLGYVVITEIPGVETFAGGAVILFGLALFNRAAGRTAKLPPRLENAVATASAGSAATAAAPRPVAPQRPRSG